MTHQYVLNVKIRDGLDGPIMYEANVSGLPETVDGTFQLIQVYDHDVTPKGIKLRKNHVYQESTDRWGYSVAKPKDPLANPYKSGY